MSDPITLDDLKIGDYVEIEYTSGERMKGGEIRGIVVMMGDIDQVQLHTGWCAHTGDKVLVRKTPRELLSEMRKLQDENIILKSRLNKEAADDPR